MNFYIRHKVENASIALENSDNSMYAVNTKAFFDRH